MLDERQYKAIECKVTGGNITEIAKFSGVSRNTIYKWIELEEFKAEVAKCQQEFISSTIQKVTSYGPKNMDGIVWLAEHAESEKVRLDARLSLLSKLVPNMTKVSVDDVRGTKDNVTIDILDKELSDADNE
ncbi:IS630 transposase-related protein [Clostridium estertheticum]|uniref:IS630 transposase-related protein n=1 Tax=Clostridium estertheticum TaxID=238834 RepID=UPI0013EE7C49|nr:phBC6A51 family helix-turn-helix protein [Clostridium estertheticum]MBZ9608647.1 IS630 transposase-related protein [Clostridium estertheticum]